MRFLKKFRDTMPDSVVKSSLYILTVNVAALIYVVMWMLVCYEVISLSRASGVQYSLLLVPIIYTGWKILKAIGIFLVYPFVVEREE